MKPAWRVAGVLAIALFLALGIWQLQRRAWKHALIARVERNMHAPAVPAPAEWRAVGTDDAYRRITASGTFLPGHETRVRATTQLGYGYWVLTPLADARGFAILVNRGFILPDHPSESAPDGQVRVTGLLRLTEPGGGILRANDPAQDRWYSRDVAAIARSRGLRHVAPYFIDADTSAASRWPRGGMTMIAFPDNHLIYALTWLALATMLAGGLSYAERRSRSANPSSGREDKAPIA